MSMIKKNFYMKREAGKIGTVHFATRQKGEVIGAHNAR